MFGRSLKFLAILGGLFVFLTLWDFFRFADRCAQYGRAATVGLKQAPPSPPEEEVLVVLTGDRNRIPQALALLEVRHSPVLIISGAGKGASLTDLVNAQRGTISNIQPLWGKLEVESNSTSTLENAIEVKKLLKDRKSNRLILITSDYHMERALQIFRSFFHQQEIVPFSVGSELTQWSWDQVPSIPAAVWKFFYEYWKWVAYRFSFH